MANRAYGERHVRSLVRGSGGRSYTVTIPVEYVKQLKWRARQKLEVLLEGDRIVIRDKK